VIHWLREYKDDGTIKEPTSQEVTGTLLALPLIHLVTKKNTGKFIDQFNAFAKRYGATDDEADAAVGYLMAYLMRDPNVPKSLTQATVIRAIAKFPEAKPLLPADIGPQCVKRWQEWCSEGGLRAKWVIDRRLLVARVDAEAAKGNRVIFLVGGGGCGKTELLSAMTERTVGALQTDSTFEGFPVMGWSAVDASWLEEEIGLWAMRGTSPDCRLDNPVTRLRTANPGVILLLQLALDGIDEEQISPRTLKAIIETARTSTDICLLITTRERDFRKIVEIVEPRRDLPSKELPQFIGLVQVEDFDDDEFSLALRNGPFHTADAGGSHYLSLSDSNKYFVSGTEQPVVSPFDMRLSTGPIGVSPPNGSFIASLRHPRMFSTVFHADIEAPGIAARALSGEAEAIEVIARMYLMRFFRKYKLRREQLGLPFAADFASLLRHMATQTLSSSAPTTEAAWRQGQSTMFMSVSKAPQLFEEAASGGLVAVLDEMSHDREWRWKHYFVAQYLAKTPIREYAL